ncbi:sugar porter family MFS transporter [Aspergillus lucknowensis]|uniref:General substrate transporter n=1 Tax=Aspergillus lucknowensis TaxID=176173 RepID=A0ABR4L628_9EURO
MRQLNTMFEPRGKVLNVMISAACSMGFLLFGYDQGVMGGAIGSSSFVRQFNHPSPLQQGLITGLYDLGCLVGSIATFIIGERLGRRKSIYVGCIIVIVGTVLQVTARTVAHLIVGRIVTGAGVGIMTSIVPTWQSEVTGADERGIYLTVQSANINTGFVLSNWISLGASYATSEFQWIFPIAMQVIFAVYLLVTVLFLVESPRWVANHISLDEATRIIARLHNKDETHEDVFKVREEIRLALEEETPPSWADLFRNGCQQNLRRMLLGFGVLYMQQLTGINSIAYYFPVVLTEYLPVSSSMAHIIAAVAATQYLMFSFVPILFIERIGRRTILIWGAVALMVLSALIAVGFNIPGQGGAIMTCVMYCLFYDAFAMSYLNVPWMYAPEINSLRMRSKGGAIASASNWLFNGIVVTVTPSSLASIGYKYYVVWAVFNASFIPMVYFLYPEVRGLSLEQIDHIFEGRGYGWSCLTQGVRESVKGAAAIEAARPRATGGDVEADPSSENSDKDEPGTVGVENVKRGET